MRSLLSVSLLAGAVAKPNPIRRVVTMLQDMQKEIGVERETEAKLFEKYQCYVKQTSADLEAKIQEAADKHKAQQAAGEGFAAQEATLAQEIEDAKKARADAKTKLDAETTRRSEEQATFEASDADVLSDVAAIEKATKAIEKGMGRGEEGFLQTNSGVRKLIEQVVNSNAAENHLDVVGQEVLSSFLQNPSASYSSQSGEIVGILKQMGEDMQKDAEDAQGAEKASKAAFAEMSASLNEIVQASGTAIEEKSMQKGEVAVKAVEALNAAKNAKKQKEDDTATLQALTAEHEEKTATFHSNQAEAAEEIKAIGMAIEILSNDDALDLFKKTDTKEFVQLSLLQVSKKARKSPKDAAVAQLTSIQKNASSATLAMLAFSAKQGLGAKKVDFSKILKMIDDMVVLLKQEQKDDRAALDQCNVDLNKAAMDKKDLDHKLKENNAIIEDLEATIATQTAVIEQAEADIKNANDSSSQATKQRTEENKVFVEDLDLNKQAVELLLKAKDKLNSFYNPDQVRKGNRQETSEEAAARANAAFLEQAPETAGPRSKKTQKSGNVLALMDQIVNELNAEVTKLETEEKQAQMDYEKLTADLAQQIADSNAAKSEAAEVKGSAEENLSAEKDDLATNTEQSEALAKYTSERTAACEFITNNFESRKSRRESEIAGLGKAKAILSGADLE